MGLRAASPHYCKILIKVAKLKPSERLQKQTYASKSCWRTRVKENESVQGAVIMTITGGKEKGQKKKAELEFVSLQFYHEKWDILMVMGYN